MSMMCVQTGNCNECDISTPRRDNGVKPRAVKTKAFASSKDKEEVMFVHVRW
jgi:hypothetical protein